jgi:hypothetical protein
MTYSINAARAQRLEAVGGEHWPFELDGTVYRLPREIPWELAEKLEQLKAMDGPEGISAILAILLGDQDLPTARLSPQDMGELLSTYMDEVGATLGESGTSPDSSGSTARPSKPTSKRSTASTSKRSTAARSAGGASKS